MGNTRGRTLTLISLVGSALLMVGLFSAWWVFGSQLALAQGADSFMDVFTAAVLTWAVMVAAQRPDEEHPFGHARAEPIGGLVVAVVAGVLAIEVARSAVEALLDHKPVTLDWLLVAVFCAKALFKVLMLAFARAAHKRSGSPALKALAVDARNDVLVSVLAIAGFFAAKLGATKLDAWLALPVAGWIAWAGIELARDNIRYLMGEAPPPERQEELREIARAVPGVKEAHDLRAHFLGTELQVHLHVVVPADLSVQQAHDIGEAVRVRLESEPDVGHCSVHIDIR
ncbi:MAG: cation diffusion facilitator family transporter [Planctomycetes bacterium]|nr:cation diffusion facilitator family transporter [Planctomycetota bacterium]